MAIFAGYVDGGLNDSENINEGEYRKVLLFLYLFLSDKQRKYSRRVKHERCMPDDKKANDNEL